jgi:hypothetical protein
MRRRALIDELSLLLVRQRSAGLQAWVYYGLRSVAKLATWLEKPDVAADLEASAAAMKVSAGVGKGCLTQSLARSSIAHAMPYGPVQCCLYRTEFGGACASWCDVP